MFLKLCVIAVAIIGIAQTVTAEDVSADMDPSTGGSRFVSQHSFLHPVLPRPINPWNDTDIKEWHFHVYWHPNGSKVDMPEGTHWDTRLKQLVLE